MKKMIAVLLACCMLSGLSACGTGEIYIHDTPEAATSVPAPVSTPFVPEQTDPKVTEKLGAPVILNIENITETYPAPDGSDRVILSFGYDDVDVFLESNPAAAEAINTELATLDELCYSGSGNGDGLNALLELATDNFSLSQDHEENANLEFSYMRSAYVDRLDSRVLSLRYRSNSYTGGAHGLYFDRVYVFDTETGRQLGFEDLCSDREAMEQAVLQKMDDTLRNDVRYQPVLDYMTAFGQDQDLEQTLKGLIREGSWSLDSVGLTVFSDIYEIASYADGIVSFTLPYEELSGLLAEKYLPLERPESGELEIMPLRAPGADPVHLLDKVTISNRGTDLRLFARGTVYNVSLETVTFISDDVGFYPTETHWTCSYLSNSGVQIQAEIPDGMPNLMVRYEDADGVEHRYLVTESGEDGSLLLLEDDQIEAVG